jgi:hypothetical protein
MTASEWITDIALLLVVLRQIRESRLDVRSFLIPLGIIGFVAHQWLTDVPTAGNDLVLILTLVAVGATLGVTGGIFTRIRMVGGHLMIKAGLVSAALWVLGMGARLGFQLYSENGGAAAIGRFSLAHDITSEQAWVAAFILMALTEVVTRLATIALRGQLVSHQGARSARPVLQNAL